MGWHQGAEQSAAEMVAQCLLCLRAVRRGLVGAVSGDPGFPQPYRRPAGLYPARRGGKDTAGSRRCPGAVSRPDRETRSEEHTSELQSLMRISYAVFCLKKKKTIKKNHNQNTT